MFRTLLSLVLLIVALPVHAALGLVELKKNGDSGPITVFYPTDQSASKIARAGIEFFSAENASVGPTNGRLVVISHGSPSSPWVHLSLIESLVQAGFIVAVPEHEGDNFKDASDAGITSWKRRPHEVSRAISRIASTDQFRNLIDFQNVGMFGMSAGGHTALTLAGGRWSPGRLLQHCEKNIAEDFHACAGPSISQESGLWGGLKIKAILAVLGIKLSDAQWYAHTDPRIKSIIAGVPFAADFDAESLRGPTVRLGLINAKQDVWLRPRFHIEPIISSCQTCEVIEISSGGHGALLSPLPEIKSESIFKLIQDPPGFDRHGEVASINAKIAEFFFRTLGLR